MSPRFVLPVACVLVTPAIARPVPYLVEPIRLPAGQFSYETGRLGNSGALTVLAFSQDIYGGVEVEFSYVYDGTSLVEVSSGHNQAPLRLLSVNDQGVAVGMKAASGRVDAIVWRAGSVTSLAAPPGYNFSAARAINDSGTAAGEVGTGSGQFVPAIWRADQVQLLTIPTGGIGSATDVNELGQVVGSVRLPNLNPRPARWDSDGLNLLSIGDGIYGVAQAVNNLSHSVGWIRLPGYRSLAAEWRGNQFVPLRSLVSVGEIPESEKSHAWDINDRGEIVGDSRASDGAGHAVLWADGQIYDLNDLLPAGSGWELYSATGINDLGMIAGYGRFQGQVQPFILTPANVPEPGVASLIVVSAVTIGARRRR
jgi:probable HAF family extracellular repeat protein